MLPPRALCRSVTAAGAALAVAGSALFLGLPAGAQDDEQGESGQAAEPGVTAAVQVTDNPDPTRAHAWPQIAVNPTNGELVVAEIESRNEKTCNVHLSTDDGRSWAPAGDPAQEPWTDCGSDPLSSLMLTVEFARDGTLYMAFAAHDPRFNERDDSELPRHVFLARSDDSGRSFETRKVFEAPEEEAEAERGVTSNRRPMVAVDPNDSSKVYVSWQQSGDEGEPAKALVAGSEDGGETFSEPVNVADERGAYQARPAVDGDGTLHVAIPTRGFDPDSDERGQRPALYRRSTDGGQTWTDVEEVDPGNFGFSHARKWMLAADPESPNLYLVWYGHEDPEAEAPEDDRELFMRMSTDSGDTWSDRILVNDDGEGVQQYDPAVTVAPNGRVDIAWYDFRNSPNPEKDAAGPPFNHGGAQDVYYASLNRGEQTPSANTRVTDRIIDRSIGVWSNNVHAHAHVGLDSTEDTVYMAWQDTRNGDADTQAEDVYFASVHHGELGSPAAASTGGQIPGWALLVAGLALGMGIAMLLAVALVRRGAAQAG